MANVPMTRSGHQKLVEELKRLKSVERPAIIQAISLAREHGDLSENAEYQYAKEKQSFIEGRIKEIDDKLARAQVIEPSSIKTNRVVFGAKVELMNIETEEKRSFRIVGADEADVKLGLLSIDSPIARQLLNRVVGDQVTMRVPKGEIEYEILKIRYE